MFLEVNRMVFLAVVQGQFEGSASLIISPQPTKTGEWASMRSHQRTRVRRVRGVGWLTTPGITRFRPIITTRIVRWYVLYTRLGEWRKYPFWDLFVSDRLLTKKLYWDLFK